MNKDSESDSEFFSLILFCNFNELSSVKKKRGSSFCFFKKSHDEKRF